MTVFSGKPMTAASAVPERLSAATLWELLIARAALSPDATMLIDGTRGVKMSFAQAHHIAERLAAGLQTTGIGNGSRVTWQLPTGIVAVMTALALARLGAVQSPVISLYGAKELGAVLQGSNCEYLLIGAEADAITRAQDAMVPLCQPPRVIPLSGELPQAHPSTLAPYESDHGIARWVYYTSGTTSQPKGALHTDRSLMLGGENLALAMAVDLHDVGSVAFPFAHIGGAMYTAMLLMTGMSAVLLERFQPAEAAAVFARHGVTTTGGSTAHYEALLTEQQRTPGDPLIPSLRLLCGGGAFCSPALHQRVASELGCTLLHNYGMTEIPLICAGSTSDGQHALAHSCGAPVSGIELRVVDAAGRTVHEQEGEVRVRGPAVFQGYSDPALNEQAFDDEGFFRTGDLGRLRADGRLVLTGRLKDVIIRKGENVSALELEEILYRHPKVSSVAVIGLPDPQRGERVCAVVEPADGQAALTFDEMVALFLSAKIMVQKIPEQLEIIDRMPRNETLKKILKHELRARFSTESAV